MQEHFFQVILAHSSLGELVVSLFPMMALVMFSTRNHCQVVVGGGGGAGKGEVEYNYLQVFTKEIFCTIKLILFCKTTWIIWSRCVKSLLYSQYFVIAGCYKVVDF